MAVSGPPLLQHMCKRYGWTSLDADAIDWQSHESVFKKLKKLGQLARHGISVPVGNRCSRAMDSGTHHAHLVELDGRVGVEEFRPIWTQRNNATPNRNIGSHASTSRGLRETSPKGSNPASIHCLWKASKFIKKPIHVRKNWLRINWDTINLTLIYN